MVDFNKIVGTAVLLAASAPREPSQVMVFAVRDAKLMMRL